MHYRNCYITFIPECIRKVFAYLFFVLFCFLKSGRVPLTICFQHGGNSMALRCRRVKVTYITIMFLLRVFILKEISLSSYPNCCYNK